MVDFKALDRLMGKPRPMSTGERMVRDQRAHQFSNDIGGASENYREPKFGHPVAKEEPKDK
jgi:hypothetical protein